MKHMVDMKRTKKSSGGEAAIECGGEKYPYGLQISLDDEDLKKLGFDELPAVGTEMIVVGLGKVTNVSEHSSNHGANRNVSIQLEVVEIEPASQSKLTAADAVTKAIKDV